MHSKYFGQLCAAVIVLLGFQTSAFAASYFIDFSAGADTNNGTSTSTPWKHCPGDANATGTAKAKTFSPGDIVNFKGGVRYMGQILFTSAGTVGNSITYEGSPAGWGTGQAIIDGSVPLTLALCTGNGTGAGQVPNANFATIYVGNLPAGANWTIPVIENGTWLDMASTSVSNPTPFFNQDTEYFYAISSGVGASSTTDAINLAQTDAAYWVGSRFLTHVDANQVASAQITAFNTTTHTITYGTLAPAGTPDVDANWDNKYHYAIVGNPRSISKAGQYAVDPVAGKIYVWPIADATAVRVGSLGFGISTNSQSYNTIRDFEISGQYGTGYESGRAITGSTSNSTNGVIITNCTIKNTEGGGASGLTYLYGQGTTECSISNCTISYHHGRGTFLTGNLIASRNNTFTYLTGTVIYSQDTAQPNANGVIDHNTISHCRGIHQNAITVYGSVGEYATNWVISNNRVTGMCQRYGNFGISAQNHQNFLIYNNVIEADGGYAGDPFGPGSSYMRVYNNVFVPVPVSQGGLGGLSAGLLRIFGCANNTTLDIRNNITAGIAIADQGSSSAINWSRATHSNNLYTATDYTQAAANGWAYGTGESNSTASALFSNPAASNYYPMTGSKAIDTGTATGAATYFNIDRDGNSRPFGGGWDIGAYEFGSGPIIPSNAVVSITVISSP